MTRHLKAVPDSTPTVESEPAEPGVTISREFVEAALDRLALGGDDITVYGRDITAIVTTSAGLLVTTRARINAPIVTTRLDPAGDIHTYRIPWTQETHADA